MIHATQGNCIDRLQVFFTNNNGLSRQNQEQAGQKMSNQQWRMPTWSGRQWLITLHKTEKDGDQVTFRVRNMRSVSVLKFLRSY